MFTNNLSSARPVKTLTAGLLTILAAILLAACSPVEATVEKQVELQLVTHLAAGMAEQDVYVERDSGVFRVTNEDAEQYLDAPAYAAAETVEHDLFGLGDNPLGPYPQGVDMGFTMGEWLAGTGTGTYTVRGNEAEIDLTFANLVPDSHYTLWCATVNVPPNPSIIDEPCGAADGSQNSFFTDEKGNAAIQLTLETLDGTTDTSLKVIAAAYHSDGKSYGASPGAFGLFSHVQLAAVIPPPNSEAWITIDSDAVASR